MSPLLIFNLITIIGLTVIIGFYYRSHTSYLVLWVAGWTIILYRLVAFFTIAYLGGFTWKENPNSLFSHIDHYHIGFALLFSALIFKKRLSGNQYFIILGLAWGMLIDEISELIAFVPGIGRLIPPNFRDTWPDTVLIAVSFIIFTVADKVFKNRYIAQK